MTRSRFASAWVGGLLRMLAMNSPGRIRNSRKRDGAVGDVFAFGEEGEKNQGGDDQDLESDGDEKRAAFVTAHARFLGGVTFYQTASKKTGAVFRNMSERHTHLQIVREFEEFCGASLPGCQRETGAALAGM